LLTAHRSNGRRTVFAYTDACGERLMAARIHTPTGGSGTMPPEKSGFYYPNKFARITIEALEEVMGKNGLNAILHLAGLSERINNSPAATLERELTFAYFTALCVALEEMYGPRGGRGLALRAGRAASADGLRGFGALAGVGDLAFKVL